MREAGGGESREREREKETERERQRERETERESLRDIPHEGADAWEVVFQGLGFRLQGAFRLVSTISLFHI